MMDEFGEMRCEKIVLCLNSDDGQNTCMLWVNSRIK